jgi:N-acetylglucosamine kinase-like BadF-type ATPase
VQVHDDMWIAYHAAFAPGEGHVVYSGSGSVGIHVRVDGSTIRVGGRGMLIDDGGSAFWIGREAVSLLYRHIDEDPDFDSPLAQSVFAACGGRHFDIVRAYVYGGGRTAVAQLARAVAAADDAEARHILHLAGGELARLALALVRRGGEKPIALLGRAATLHPAIIEGFRAAAPALRVEVTAPDAALAAARLAVRAESAQA